MNRFARIIFILFLSILTSAVISHPILAQDAATGWYDQGYAESIQSAQGGDVNAAAHVSNVNTNNYSDLIRRIIGPVPGITTTETGMTPYNQQLLSQSAIKNIASYIGIIYSNPPANTYAFIQDVGQTLGFLPKQVQAQGIGFSGLSALLPIWKALRNIAYLLLAVVMTVIGFLVMFRKKIDPKTVVTVQNALPRIIITLLLITFSYAIVGIAIDFMYLLIAICIGVFQSTGMLPPDVTASKYISGNLLNVVFSSVDFWQLPLRLLGFRADATTVNLTAGSIGTIVGIALAATFDAVFVGIAVFVIGMSGVIFALLVGLAMLLLSIRLFIFFLSTYIKIILALIFAPLQLVMGAVPGNDAFGSWFKNLIANILIFPASAAMFLLASVFMQLSNSSVDRLWAPPYVGLTSYSATSIGALVALGILFAIPNIGKQIQEAFKSKGGMQAGLGGVASVFTQPVQLLMQGYQFYTSHETMKAFRKKDDKHA